MFSASSFKIMDSITMNLLIACAMMTLTQGFNQEYLQEAMLEKLGLKEFPKIHKRDLENLVVPTHLRNKYLSMLKMHHSRRRRSLPSLAGILKGITGNSDISGQIVYSDATRERIVFDMTARIPANSEVTMAELRLFQTAPRKPPVAEKRSRVRVSNARVSVHWVEVQADGSNRTSLVDSRLVPIHKAGWQSFDVSQAVAYWSKGSHEAPLHLELRIEGDRPGSHAAEMAKNVRFTTQGASGSNMGTPELLLFTLNLEEYGAGGDCTTSKSNGMCCREEHFVNFRELTWTQFWVIEPAGYQGFRCAGGCKQPKRYHGYGERRCAVMESAPLPIMYLVKKGDFTQIEVAEFPNMIVEKCGCTMDNNYT